MSTFSVLYNYASALCRRSSKRCRVCLPLKNFLRSCFFFLFPFIPIQREGGGGGDFVDEMMKTN